MAKRKLPRIAPQDVIGGVSMALFLIPQSLAYAVLAGLPPHIGLYAAGLPPLAAAIFASSPYLQTGPTAITSILVAAGLAAILPTTASPIEYVLHASLLALIVGVIRVGIGLLRAGQIVYLMSEPVLRGFMAGAAMLIVLSQLPVVLGLLSPPSSSAIARAIWMVGNVGQWDLTTILIAASAFAVAVGAPRLHPLMPGVLIATVGGLVLSRVTGYQGAVVGLIPNAFPGLELSLPWTSIPELVLPGIIIALVGF